MPSHCFQANDPCSCKVRVCNPSENPRSNLVLWAVLDLAGQCFFGPSFTGDLDNYLSIYPEFPPGESVLTVFPEFAWPENAGTFDNAIVYAALTGPDGSIAGFWDLWVFGWN